MLRSNWQQQHEGKEVRGLSQSPVLVLLNVELRPVTGLLFWHMRASLKLSSLNGYDQFKNDILIYQANNSSKCPAA